MPRLLALLLWAGAAYAAGAAAELARSIAANSLDPQECYRVRELSLVREDVRFFFTDGYLIFAKPVAGRRVAAIFTADVEGGDAEVLILPPSRSERKSLASFIDSPNLDEHISAAVLLFTDDSDRVLEEQIRSNPFNRRSPERGVLLEQQWSPTVRNLSESFVTRLTLDLLAPGSPGSGFVMAAVSGAKLGNFDIAYDPRGVEQVIVGQMASRDNRTFFNVWTSFQARSFRGHTREPAAEYSLSDYRIDATLEPDLSLEAVTRVKVHAGRAPLPALDLDIHPNMRVSAALVDGAPAEVLARESLRSDLIRNSGNTLFLVVPSQPLSPGTEHEVEIHHSGKVILDAGNHVYYVGARGNWYPQHSQQFATYDLRFRYPKELDLVTPGQVVADTTQGDWRTTERRTAAPVRVVGFNLGRYQRVRAARAGYTVEAYANRTVERALQPSVPEPITLPPSVWARQRRSQLPATTSGPPPPSPSARLQELASAVAGALEFMSLRFGPPALPLLTVSPVPGTFGQGFPGLIYLSTLSYLGPQAKPLTALSGQQQLFFTEILQAHETAHQWWGNLITAEGYHDEWLMEALADYSALLYLEKRKGPRALEAVLEEYKQTLLSKGESGRPLDAAGPIVLGLRLQNSQEPRAWRAITYGKGSWIMHMLRRRMGDQRFQSLLAELCRRYARKSISTAQFRQVAAEFLPPGGPDPKLENFFEQWVYGTGIPELKLSWSLKGKTPALRLAGTLTQSGVDEDFSVPVPVEISFGKGKAQTQWLRSAGEPVAFSVPLRRTPVKVVLDPGFSVLRR
ncbi:MAG TPA: M1 family aminopeptidase [Bryobacteraceae bacterium]|nr:M1 family aminopeptidase [Bryobacteraceae bacterium]